MGCPKTVDPDASRYQRFKRQVYYALDDPRDGCLIAKLFSAFIFLLITVNVFLIFAEYSIQDDPSGVAALTPLDVFSVVFFAFEYILRLWTADMVYPKMRPAAARLRYILSLMGIIDLLAFLPALLPYAVIANTRIIKSIRLIRLFRITKASRYMEGLASIRNVFKKHGEQILSAFMVLCLLIICSAVIMYEAEHDAQPDVFKNVWSSLYWAVTTVTTTGYGDVTPITSLGRAMGVCIMILSIGAIAIPSGIMSAGFVEESQALSRKPEFEKRRAARRDSEAENAYEDETGKTHEDANSLDVSENVRHADTPTEVQSTLRGSIDDEYEYCGYCGHTLAGIDDADMLFCPFCGHGFH